MGITGGIIQIIVLLLPVILTAIAAHNTPQAVQQKQDDEIDKAVINGDTDAINVLVHDKLQDKSGCNPRQQGDSI